MKQWTNNELLAFLDTLSLYTNIFTHEGKVALGQLKDIIAENEQLKKQVELLQFSARNDQGLD
jgi:hypothetical protein